MLLLLFSPTSLYFIAIHHFSYTYINPLCCFLQSTCAHIFSFLKTHLSFIFLILFFTFFPFSSLSQMATIEVNQAIYSSGFSYLAFDSDQTSLKSSFCFSLVILTLYFSLCKCTDQVPIDLAMWNFCHQCIE